MCISANAKIHRMDGEANMRDIQQEAWKSSHRYKSKQKCTFFNIEISQKKKRHQKICQKRQATSKKIMRRANKTTDSQKKRIIRHAIAMSYIQCVVCSELSFFSFPLGVYKCSAVCIFYIIFQWMFCFKFNILFACRVGALFFFGSLGVFDDSSLVLSPYVCMWIFVWNWLVALNRIIQMASHR